LLVLAVGLSGLVGTWFGGEVIAKLAGGDERRQLKMVALLYAGGAVTGSVVYVVPTLEVSMLALTVTSLIFAAGNGPLFAASQTLVAPHMRATSIAVMYFFCNLIGLGLGPLCVGALSDSLSRNLGDEALRYALLVFSPGYLWCAWHLWRAAQETRVHDTWEDTGRQVRLDHT
jgi:MFS transporter, Spinster family, sphingosine-1-phosphate transporter